MENIETVKNTQGKEYVLAVPVFFSCNRKIYRWNRRDSKYDEITFETFLEETNQKQVLDAVIVPEQV